MLTLFWEPQAGRGHKMLKFVVKSRNNVYMYVARNYNVLLDPLHPSKE